MLIPLSWLREYVDINLPTAELAERLTLAGLEVEAIHRVGDWWDPDLIRVGEVVAVHPHPDADRLVLVDVDYGAEETQRVVTGAPNLYHYKGTDKASGTLPTAKAPFARNGAILIDAYSDKTPRPKKKLKPAKIRGVKSSGMVCSELELGMSEEHEGILMLPEDAPVGMPLRDYLGDEVIELELTPDVARCLNMIGVAREVAALTDADLHLPADTVESTGDDQVSDYFDVRIDDADLCNRYTGMMIRDITLGPSPKWLQDRLILAGQRPINNVVDITNYVMLEWGQPLHAFDYDVLVERAKRVGDDTPTIIVRRAADKSKFTTLDDIARNMDNSMLMIADTAGDIAIGGVMGGQESEVSDSTVNILLEAATFEGINNRRTAAQLRLPSEASYRFARGIPATLNPIGARRAAELMREYAGGRIVPGMVDTYPMPQAQPIVYTTANDNQRLLGMNIALDDVTSALHKLDFTVKQVADVAADAPADATFALQRKSGEPLLECTPPWHRLDIRYPADLTEEVARIIGYEHVHTTLIRDVLPPQHRDPMLETEEQIRDILAAIGLQETVNHPLTTIANHLKLVVRGVGSDAIAPVKAAANSMDAEGFITLTNPVSEQKQNMRRSMLVSGLENFARNLRFTGQLSTFEVGRIYLPEEGDGQLPLEERRLCIAMTGPREVPNYYNGFGANDGSGSADDSEMDFFDLKGVVEALCQALGYRDDDLEFIARPDTGTFGPRCAEVKVKGVSLGLMGEIHPQVRGAFDLSAGRVCMADFRIAPLVKPEWNIDPMPPISTYPPVVEDLAFVVAEPVTVRQVADVMRKVGGELLTTVELFDIYRGESIAVGHKSLAYRLVYQSPERGLSEKEVTKLRQKIIRTVAREVDGKLRG